MVAGKKVKIPDKQCCGELGIKSQKSYSKMRTKHSKKSGSLAFTLIELLAIVAILALLSCLVIPAMARARIKSPGAGCMNHLRQMMVGWAMYRDENSDYLLPNAPVGTAAKNGWCNSSSEGWTAVDANTNVANQKAALLAPYIGYDISLYKCPGDVVPSDNGQRIRSYSMNAQMGAVYDKSTIAAYNPGYAVFVTGSDFTGLKPADGFIFCDESPVSLQDGLLQINSGSPVYPDVPAAYLGGACGFSFADGHAEVHRWLSPVLPSIPVYRGFTTSSAAVGFNNPDWKWLNQHATY